MTTLTVEIDETTAGTLRQISESEGRELQDTATRLLKRAILLARPRPVYDREAVKRLMSEIGQEEVELAESGASEQAALLEAEDRL